MIVSNNITIDAVNRILSSIGDAPVDSLEDISSVDVENAINELERVSRQEQARGWSFNVIPEYVLNPDTTNQRISWSSTFLRLRALDGTLLTRKDDYIFNATKQTFIFGAAIKAEAVILQDFEELPEAMRDYITAKASRDFQRKYLGDKEVAQQCEEDLQEAWRNLQEYEMDMNDFNTLNNQTAFDVIGGRYR